LHEIHNINIIDLKLINDFNYMKLKFNDNIFDKMQRIYVLDDESMITIDEVKNTIKILFEIFKDL
jgi:hypothetical protein